MCVTFLYLPTLLVELNLKYRWYRVFPKLKSKLSDFNNVKAYVVLYHEATVMLRECYTLIPVM
jgi:hypothetical protein